MKVYVKKDSVLKLLGEGKVYSKKDLVLREMDGDNTNNDTVSINLAPDNKNTSISDLSRNAQTARTQVNAAGKQVVGDVNIEDMEGISQPTIGPNDPGSDMFVTAQDSSAPAIRQAGVAAANGKISNVRIPLNQSVTSKKVMDEMRANSVPFTKSELTEFLNSL